MSTVILKTYDYLKKHKIVCFLLFFFASSMLAFSLLHINYKEDISDFLPLQGTSKNALNVYQNISGTNNIVAIFQLSDSSESDPDILVDGISSFLSRIDEIDSLHSRLRVISQVDLGQMSEVSEFVYENIPFFLTEKDYNRIDSLLEIPGYIEDQLQHNKQMMLMPGGGLLAENIGRDPLNLFTPVVTKLHGSTEALNYEIYDGYIFSPDMEKAFVIISSPYGSSETDKNGHLLSILQSCADSTCASLDKLDIHLSGGPAVAVGNASQIKKDSILSISIAVFLILILLIFTFRSVKNLVLIIISISWGWLFGLGGLALVHNNVSLIVLGISSVIIGIAVNYPLHLIAHLYHCKDMKSALREIASPLVVGNITTVGAFLCLVPLDSIALRDLGIFSSFLLIGTILFVLIFLPHITRTHQSVNIPFLERVSNLALEDKPAIIVVVVVFTFIFGYFSFYTEFDSDMNHINYMTEQQKDDMAYFQKHMTKASDNLNLYLVSSGNTIDDALDKNSKAIPYLESLKLQNKILDYTDCSQFLVSSSEQKYRLNMWNGFVEKYSHLFNYELKELSDKAGYSPDSFDDFFSIISGSYTEKDFNYFEDFAKMLFASNISIDSLNQRYDIVNTLTVSPSKLSVVKNYLESVSVGSYIFDVQSINRNLTNAISDNFNYIGWACGLIVFIFLWFSFNSIELALLSFLPMAVSWIWILGIMGLIGINFNIVNVILATFIFGQGDDYTIFMTEGASYEYAYRKKLLPTYKSSIIISALIMFIGIGSLIVAKHPALHSLAEVTIVGMFSVVLMAYIFPPFIFKLLVKKGKQYRIRPLNLKSFFAKLVFVFLVACQTLIICCLGIVLFEISKTSEKKVLLFRNVLHRLMKFDVEHLPGVRLCVDNASSEQFDVPSIIACDYHSMYELFVVMSLSTKIVPVIYQQPSKSRLIRRILLWLNVSPLCGVESIDGDYLHTFIKKGYSLTLVPNTFSSGELAEMYQNPTFYNIIRCLKVDVIPVFSHGINHTLAHDHLQIYPGRIDIVIGNRRLYEESVCKDYPDYVEYITILNQSEYSNVVKRYDSANYYHYIVMDRYRYKGVNVTKTVKRNLQKYKDYSKWIDVFSSIDKTVIVDNGFGEFALMYALVHKDKKVMSIIKNDDNRSLAKHCAEGVAENLEVAATFDETTLKNSLNVELFLVDPSVEMKKKYVEYEPKIVQL